MADSEYSSSEPNTPKRISRKEKTTKHLQKSEMRDQYEPLSDSSKKDEERFGITQTKVGKSFRNTLAKFAEDLGQSSDSEKSRDGSGYSYKKVVSEREKSGKFNSLRKGLRFLVGNKLSDKEKDFETEASDDRHLSNECRHFAFTEMTRPFIESCNANDGDSDEDTKQSEERKISQGITVEEAGMLFLDANLQEAGKALEVRDKNLNDNETPDCECGCTDSEESSKSEHSEEEIENVKPEKSKKTHFRREGKPASGSNSPKRIEEELIFPPSPRSSLEELLSTSPKEIPMTLFTNDELEGIFKNCDFPSITTLKICKAPSIEALDNVIQSRGTKNLGLLRDVGQPMKSNYKPSKATGYQCHKLH